MKRLLVCAVLGCIALHAKDDPLEGLWQGYDGEWGHVSRQLWRLPKRFRLTSTRGVRLLACDPSSEVFMHISIENFSLLSVTGPPCPPISNRRRWRRRSRQSRR